jgi:hypothetical protein
MKDAGSFGVVYVKGLLGFGKPGRQRHSMQYGYNARRSWWHEVKVHAHLVIAVVGTMALMAVAAVALWLAMPSSERQALAEVKAETQPQAAAPAAEVPASPAVAAAVTPASPPVEAAAAGEPEAPAVQAAVPELDPQAAAAIAIPAEGDAGPASENGQGGAQQEMPLVAVIPTPKPALPDASASAGDAAEPEKASGHTLRAVTMRSGPKTGAGAIGTIPAKSAIEVVSCEKWCEIVYKGKRGFVYRSFVARD